jgi:hypothetical protein
MIVVLSLSQGSGVMDPDMSSHVGLDAEGAITVLIRAGKRFFAGMGEDVGTERGGSGEGFVALMTDVFPLCRIHQ